MDTKKIGIFLKGIRREKARNMILHSDLQNLQK